MRGEEIFKMIALTVVVLLPALTVTLAIAARFALKPIAESILQIRNAFNASQPKAAEGDSVRLLQQEVADLRHSVEHLRDVVEFERALGAPGATPALKADHQPQG